MLFGDKQKFQLEQSEECHPPIMLVMYYPEEISHISTYFLIPRINLLSHRLRIKNQEHKKDNQKRAEALGGVPKEEKLMDELNKKELKMR